MTSRNMEQVSVKREMGSNVAIGILERKESRSEPQYAVLLHR